MKFSGLASLALVPALLACGTARADGLAVYNANCSVCHQAEGAGSPGQFPTLKGRIDKIAATPEGKAYLADVVLNGLHGSITAGGSPYMGFMPSLKSLNDADLASALTYLASLGATRPAPVITAADIAAERAKPMKNKELLAERKALDAAHPIP